MYNAFFTGDHEDLHGSRYLNAAANGDLDYVKKYLENHSAPDLERGGRGSTALSLSTWNQHHEVIKLLLSKGANPNEEAGGFTPISISIFLGDTISFDMLVKQANLNEKSGYGWTLLQQACGLPNPKSESVSHIALILLNAGLDPNLEYPDGDTPLIKLIERDRYEAVSIILAHGADPTKANQKGATPIEVAENKIIEHKTYLQNAETGIAEFDAGKKGFSSRESLVEFKNEQLVCVQRLQKIITSLSNMKIYNSQKSN